MWLPLTSTQKFQEKLLDHLISRLRFPGMADDGSSYPTRDRAQVSTVFLILKTCNI